MKLPLKWLKEYVDFNVTTEKFVELMMWRGFEIAEVLEELPIHHVYVGKILEITQHENAEKLRVCQVDVGQDAPVQIVTNAKNVSVGDFVPVALDGAVLTGNFEIHPTVMRGTPSVGMFCGGAELGLTDADYPGASCDSVLVFNEEHKPGETIQDATGLDSVVFDIELTPNRADCQSIIGICREAAAALGQKFVEPTIKHVDGVGNEAEYASVCVENTELCSRYTARIVTDLTIEPSPAWMQKRLRSVGLRPINNIVDITNYVLIEYGHPMHAFDLACVENGAIIVRSAKDGEHVTTLDGKEHVMSSDMLVISDPNKGVAIAGIMGGENSEITNSTKAALFESAAFKASSIRATSRKLRATSDSAQRFMRGVEAHNAYLALERAIELVNELGAGKVIGKVIDVCSVPTDIREISVDWKHVNAIIGSDFSPEYMAELLATININAVPDGDTLKVFVPQHRTDIEDGIESDSDIAEEVARIHGYYNLTPILMHGDTFRGGIPESYRDDDKLHDFMVAMGAYEMYNFNFMSPTHLDILKLAASDTRRQAVAILNPFGEEQSLMRTTLLPGMLDSLSRNIKRKTEHGRFFEIGNVHFDNNDDLPEERNMLGIAYMGEGEDFFTQKGTVEQLMEAFNIKDYRFVAGGSEYLCPGKKAEIFVCGEKVGEMGAVHPDVLKAFELPIVAYVAEIDTGKLLARKGGTVKYSPIPKFPVVERDLAIIVDNSIVSDDVCDCILNCDIEPIVEGLKLFDIYRGIGIPAGKKSLAYTFKLRFEDRTMTDADISAAMAEIVRTLEEKLGAKLR